MADWQELSRSYLHHRLAQFQKSSEPAHAGTFDAGCALQQSLTAAANTHLFKYLSPALWDLRSIYQKAAASIDGPPPELVDADTNAFFDDLAARRLALKLPAEILDAAIENFARRFGAYAHRFIGDCIADLHLIAEGLPAPRDASNRIISIDPLQSDPHDNHFGVVRVGLTDGQTWFYKPRSGAIDGILEEFFRASERCLDLAIPVHTAQVIDCTDHHWSRQVHVRAIHSVGELELQSHHLGILTALAYCLNANDLHYQNVLFGESLFIVDAETFFVASPPKRRPAAPVHDDPLLDPLTNELARTSLVPSWQGGRFAKTWDVTPLGSRGVFQLDAPVVQPDAVGDAKDIWTFARQENVFDPLSLDDAAFGRLVCDAFLAGFRECFASMCSRRAQFAELLHELPIPYCRSLIRSTRYYEQLIVQSFHPLALYGARSRRDILVSQLNDMSVEMPWISQSIIDYEVSCLLSFSIPCFYNDPRDSDLLFTGGREAHFFPRPALAEIFDRLSRIDHADLRAIEERITRQFEKRFAGRASES